MSTVRPQTRRWTRAEYRRMADLGWFRGQRVELIEGEVMVLSPQNPPHYLATDRTADVLRRSFGHGFWVRMQGPLNLGAACEPEPDVCVARGRREDYTDHPGSSSAVLVVEVSDSSLEYDRGEKASLYASAGIAEYWVLNLVDGELEVHRSPRRDPSRPYGHPYDDVQVLRRNDTVTPLALPGRAIAVADLLGAPAAT